MHSFTPNERADDERPHRPGVAGKEWACIGCLVFVTALVLFI